ncbi:hypothetical protein [Aureimonas jatrophae]|uniref:Uncharacterized protein n=1 Tax=Aureimonas jatrophae TaxID=1166073 RepID=A0A1H0M0P4_9HYPH|nr:hypothetical protein [Aureimonas jatrophae]MBB3952680.1 hypothetical protein [Aureimonas jatrophae]SDO73987.1 hypothetical protein SAMN05192530_11214 [Aureimonas jatrophae]
MMHAQSKKISQGAATRQLLDEMAFAIAALGALVTAARARGVSLDLESERMEDLANRLLDLSEEAGALSGPGPTDRRPANIDLQ